MLEILFAIALFAAVVVGLKLLLILLWLPFQILGLVLRGVLLLAGVVLAVALMIAVGVPAAALFLALAIIALPFLLVAKAVLSLV